jgi:hypothetical protein
MDDLARMWSDLVGRLSGPLTFRLILQPTMAIIYALRDGAKDAREGRPPYFWTMFTEPDHARAMIDEGFKAVGRVLALGVVMDVIYQLIVFRWVYPVELILVVLLLAFIPYLLLRGPANRFAHLWSSSNTKKSTPTR